MIIGFQDWTELLFVHWKVPAEVLRPHVHRRLSIDERDGSAWVSMTPFTLKNGRLRGLPPLADFHELNFRTYVTLPGHEPGIWFFSLDANNTLAVVAARMSVRLPYFPAYMDRGDGYYRSARRIGRGMFDANFNLGIELGRAAPGSLEEFLCERYVLYSRAAGPALWKGRVRHEPWPLIAASVSNLIEDLSVAQGMPELGKPAATHYSRGVHVEFEAFRPC